MQTVDLIWIKSKYYKSVVYYSTCTIIFIKGTIRFIIYNAHVDTFAPNHPVFLEDLFTNFPNQHTVESLVVIIHCLWAIGLCQSINIKFNTVCSHIRMPTHQDHPHCHRRFPLSVCLWMCACVIILTRETMHPLSRRAVRPRLTQHSLSPCPGRPLPEALSSAL